MRKSFFVYFIYILLFSFCVTAQVFATSEQDVSVSQKAETKTQVSAEEKKQTCEGNVCEIDVLEISRQQRVKDITKFFSDYQQFYNSHNIKKLISLYETEYTNNDGLNLNQQSKLIKNAFDNFPNIKSEVKIVDIISDTKYAIVYTHIKDEAQTKSPSKITNDKGDYISSIYKIFYLKEVSGDWKIYSDKTIDEFSITSYGVGKNIHAELLVPQNVLVGNDYVATTCVFPPDGYSPMASINKGEIREDFVQSSTAYRSINRNTGTLERMFKANNDNNTEYVVASIGFSKISSSMFKDASLDLKGLILLMKRVNIIPNTKNLELQKAKEIEK